METNKNIEKNNVVDFMKSKTAIFIIAALFIIAVLLLSFSAGVAVGYRKQDFLMSGEKITIKTSADQGAVF